MKEKTRLYRVKSPMFTDSSNHCFACGRENQSGLRLKDFMVDDEWIYCDVSLGENYTGFPGIIHGGIQSTVLDEIMAWAVIVFERSIGVTIDMKVKFKKPLPSCRIFRARARIEKKINRIINICSYICMDDIVYTEGRANYLLIDGKKALKMMGGAAGMQDYTVELEEA